MTNPLDYNVDHLTRESTPSETAASDSMQMHATKKSTINMNLYCDLSNDDQDNVAVQAYGNDHCFLFMLMRPRVIRKILAMFQGQPSKC